MQVNTENEFPNWINYIVKLARPGVMISVFLAVIFSAIIFSTVEFFSPGSGLRASMVFTKHLSDLPVVLYDTLQWMFAAYVGGRSAQDIAGKLMKGKVGKDVQ